jgi:hypothetical protein
LRKYPKMNEPKSKEDVWPHTETVIFLTDLDHCFGNPIKEVINQVSNCDHLGKNGNHQGNELSADFHRFGRERVEDIDEIIPNSLIFVHCDLVLDTKMYDHLKGSSIPGGSEIVVLIEDSNYSDPERRIYNLTRSVEIATSLDDVMDEARRYFKTICPECRGDPAKGWVFNWKKAVYHRVEN